MVGGASCAHLTVLGALALGAAASSHTGRRRGLGSARVPHLARPSLGPPLARSEKVLPGVEEAVKLMKSGDVWATAIVDMIPLEYYSEFSI